MPENLEGQRMQRSKEIQARTSKKQKQAKVRKEQQADKKAERDAAKLAKVQAGKKRKAAGKGAQSISTSMLPLYCPTMPSPLTDLLPQHYLMTEQHRWLKVVKLVQSQSGNGASVKPAVMRIRKTTMRAVHHAFILMIPIIL